ncbi:MAG: aminopeptidase [Candidatus Bathyarchaeia archaeon]|jgi:leucyl aminopeptidase (aminopeptidase T)
MQAIQAAKNALTNVLDASSGEYVVIICDQEKTQIANAFTAAALEVGLWTRLVVLPKTAQPRTEIPETLQKALKGNVNIFINLLSGNREETPFRIKLIKQQTQSHKSRLGHCPGVTLDMLTLGALALTPKEHEMMQSHAQKLMRALQDVATVQITNPKGTNLTLSVKNREFYSDTKLNWETMKWMNLPTGEVIVAPVEDSLNGKLVCDMAVGGIGKLRAQLEAVAENGKVKTVTCQDEDQLKRIKETFATDQWSDIVGEFAFGINPKARVTDEFLEAEKILGTVHVAFGANTDMPGGKNASKNHMDILISKPTVKVTKQNRQTFTVLENGKYSDNRAE